MEILIALMRVVLIIGIVCLAILLYWHFRRIKKTIIATLFWIVTFLTSLTPMMQIVQAKVPMNDIPFWYLCLIVVVPMAIIGALFFNPLKPPSYSFDEDDDNDEPFDVPDQV